MTNRLIVFTIALLFSTFCFSQETDAPPKFGIGLTTGVFLTGELDASHNFSAGLQGQYFFKHTENFNHFATLGFTRDINTEGINLTAIDLGIGTEYDLFNIGKRPIYLTAYVSALYYNETFSVELIEGTRETSFDEFGFKANFGIGYHISKRLSLAIGLTQFHTNGTTAGFHLSYRF